MLDFTTLELDFMLFIKIILLVFIGSYAIFAIVIVHHVRSLNRVVTINKALGSPLVQTLALLYLAATVALFLAAVVIL